MFHFKKSTLVPLPIGMWIGMSGGPKDFLQLDFPNGSNFWTANILP